jgi:hypothetical protein
MEPREDSTVFCETVIMYNFDHGLEDDEGGSLRRLRPRVDSVHRESDLMRQQEMSEHAVGQRRRRWTHKRGKEQEEARSANFEAIVACTWGLDGLLRDLRLPCTWHGR